MKLTEEQLNGMYYYVEEFTTSKKTLKKDPNKPKKYYALWIPIFGSIKELDEIEIFLACMRNGEIYPDYDKFLNDREYLEEVCVTRPIMYSIYNAVTFFEYIKDENGKFYFDNLSWRAIDSYNVSIAGNNVSLVMGMINLMTYHDIIHYPPKYESYQHLLNFVEESTSKFIWHFEFMKQINRIIFNSNTDYDFEDTKSEKKKNKIKKKLYKIEHGAPYMNLKRLKKLKAKDTKFYTTRLVKVQIIPTNISLQYVGYDYEDIIEDNPTKILRNSVNKRYIQNLFDTYEFNTGEKLMLSVVYDKEFRISDSIKPINGTNTNT